MKTQGSFIGCAFVTKYSEPAKWHGMAHARGDEYSSSLLPLLSKSRWMYPNHPLETASDIIYILVTVLGTWGKWSQPVLVSDYVLCHSIQYLERLGYIF